MDTAGHPKEQRTARLALLCVGALAVCALLSHGLRLVYGLMDAHAATADSIVNRDFANYWLAGKLVLTGSQQALFNYESYRNVLSAVFGPAYPPHNWSYPPHFPMFVAPLGFLEYFSALAAFLLATLALYVFAAITFRRVYAPTSDARLLTVAMIGFAVMMLNTTQNGFLTAGCALLGLAWMKQRPVLAGLAFACLTIKPQLGLLIPVLLVFERNWRAMLWAAVFTATLIVASIALFGIASWHAYFTDTVPFQGSVLDWHGAFLLMMPNIFGSLRTLGLESDLALTIQWVVSGIFAGLSLWLLRKETETLPRVCIALCATFLVSPYGFDYDMGALTVAAAVLAGSGALAGSATLLIAIVASLPAAIRYLGWVSMPITPLILAGCLYAIVARQRPLPSPVPLANANSV
jgi:hypothetical protein